MKRVKFADPLPRLVLEKKKDTTWRINDDKALTAGDLLSLCHINGEEFGKAKIIWIKETSFGELTSEDKEGHEKFSSDEEMYKTYEKYYSIAVNQETKVKIVKFRLI